MFSQKKINTNYLVLPSKIKKPPLPQGHISRLRLLDKLDIGAAKSCITIHAPAGFGKSTLLSEWAEKTDLAVFWYSLDELDNELGRFFSYVYVAIKKQFPQIDGYFFEDEKNLSQGNFEKIVSNLLEIISSIKEKTYFIFDDCHFIDNPDIWHALDLIIDRKPKQFCIVLGSRTESKVSLSSFKQQDILFEIDIADLKFSDSETDYFLKKNLPDDTPANSKEIIRKEINGWIAGLQLTLISYKQLPKNTSLTLAYEGHSQRLIQDYLVEEVLKKTDQHILDFLYATTICRRFSVELANELTGGNNADLIIDQLQRDQLFILPEGTAEPWYRYHSIFRQSLLKLWHKDQPNKQAALHLKAAKWWARRGFVSEAGEHTIRSNDINAIKNLLIDYGWKLYHSGQYVTLNNCFKKIPPLEIYNSAELSLLFSWLCLINEKPDLASETIEDAQHLLEGKEAFDPSLEAAFNSVRATIAIIYDDFNAAIFWANQALPYLKENMWWERTHSYLAIAEATFIKCNYDQALSACNSAQHICTLQNYHTLLIHTSHIRAKVYLATGEILQCKAVQDEALSKASKKGLSALFAIDYLYRAAAISSRILGKYDDALLLLHQAELKKRPLDDYWLFPTYTEKLNILVTTKSNNKQINSIVDTLNELPSKYHFCTEWLIKSDQALVLYWIMSSNIDKLKEILLQKNEFISEERVYVVTQKLTFAMLELAMDNLEQAWTDLEQIHTEASTLKLENICLTTQLLKSACLFKQNKQQESKEYMIDILSNEMYAAAIGDIQLIHSAFQLPSILPEQLPFQTNSEKYHFLGQECQQKHINNELSERSKNLTPKEWQVISLIARQSKNEAIAEDLGITLTTVRSHIKNINRKLGLTNRQETISCAVALTK